MAWRFIAFVAAAALAGCSDKVDRDLPIPVQGEASETAVEGSDGRIVGIADFDAEVLVLSRREYEADVAEDPLSSYAPLDVVAAWGAAGRKAVRDPVHIAQGRRRYAWDYRGGPEVPRETASFGALTANWHLIPSGKAASEGMDSIRRGDVVRIRGRLAKVRLRDGSWATSSTSRTDDGDGACEIILVESVSST